MNPHVLSDTSSLSWRVCQFRHSDVAPDRPGSAVNLPARPLLPARRRHLGSRHPRRIRFQTSTPTPQGRPAALVSALRKAATDRTCRAIGIPLSHRAAELLVSADETEAPDAYMRCYAGAINQDLKRQPWSALVATLAGKALRRNRG